MSMMPQSKKYKPYRDMHTVSGSRWRKDGDFGVFGQGGSDEMRSKMMYPKWHAELKRKREAKMRLLGLIE